MKHGVVHVIEPLILTLAPSGVVSNLTSLSPAYDRTWIDNTGQKSQHRRVARIAISSFLGFDGRGKRLEAVHAGAVEIRGLLAEKGVRARYKLLESKVKLARVSTGKTQSQIQSEPNVKANGRKRGSKAATHPR